jgi:uncharacterized protein (DUF1778 family)
MEEAMNKRRIQVYTDPETKRRIELAAAKQQTSVTEYCLAAIEQQLADDDMLEREQIDIPVTSTQLEAALIADLRQLRGRISADRRGAPIDLDNLFDELHDERDHELFSMR